ncbi:molybdopterin-dependent oxidoreductase [Nocardioides iriomotensis]|uniref:Molybdopterin-binding oxidoreductase n=1 Tax=Nocardioides iriomotensis TaxID=715784 RepID=A0A4Q5IWX7_9ACTN|nr:molybdopterin-dependent oxidoreductase [Nocardioides iriomotensis]RYU09431.1 molybdopterin-binding oxidoreductase [Nocardioides iriomotensis]
MTTRGNLLAGGLAGLLAGAAAVAVSEAVAAALDGVTSPLLAVANRAVDAAPRPVKEWAVATFGTADKAVLIGGVIGTVAVIAVVAGAVGVRRPRVALGAFVLLALVATAAALTDRAATAGPAARVLPAVVLLLVGFGSLTWLLGTLRRPARPPVMLPTGVPGDDLPAAFDRRVFLRAAAAVAVAASAGGLAARALGGSAAAAARADLTVPRPTVPAPPLPTGVDLGVDGLTPYLTSNRDFYRVDTALRVPDVPLDGWTLRIHGMVDKELTLTFQDLLERRLVEDRITLTCVSNEVGGEYVGNAAWIGVPMRDLLEEAGVQAGADAVKSTSADDFTVGTPLEVLQDPQRNALVAIAMNGEPLPLEHGFPARMVTPGLYGYVSATKWLVDLEVTRFADFQAYWTTRGYSAQAPIKTSSRIDVPRSFARLKKGRNAVAGVAWSQDRGIAKVEVRVDGGAWQEADLAAADNVNTWRQWVYRWDAEPGSHKLEVRATDRSGYTQTSERTPIAPDGSTGWHSVDVVVG